MLGSPYLLLKKMSEMMSEPTFYPPKFYGPPGFGEAFERDRMERRRGHGILIGGEPAPYVAPDLTRWALPEPSKD